MWNEKLELYERNQERSIKGYAIRFINDIFVTSYNDEDIKYNKDNVDSIVVNASFTKDGKDANLYELLLNKTEAFKTFSDVYRMSLIDYNYEFFNTRLYYNFINKQAYIQGEIFKLQPYNSIHRTGAEIVRFKLSEEDTKDIRDIFYHFIFRLELGAILEMDDEFSEVLKPLIHEVLNDKEFEAYHEQAMKLGLQLITL